MVVAVLTGCGSVSDTPPDAAEVPVDAPDAPGTTVRVSTSGDDGNDGLVEPVKTLKRALGIATANPEIVKINVESGRYNAATGETFPYTITSNLIVAGPAGGGAIFEGNGTTPALTMERGRLQDLELEKFTVALTSSGPTDFAGIRIREADVALRGETGSVISANQIDVTGAVRACAIGIELNGNANLTSTAFVTRTLGTQIDAKATSSFTMIGLNVTGEPGCTTPLFPITTTGTVTLIDSLVGGGGGNGLSFASGATARITNTIIRNLTGSGDAIGGRANITMTGGELTNNARAGMEVFAGTFTLTNVTIKQNGSMGLYVQGSSAAQPGILKMRGCTVQGNGHGVYLFDFAQADFGTTADPGNNTFTGNSSPGINVDGFGGPRLIEAVGNTWRPSVQSADATGKYPTTQTLVGGGANDLTGAVNFSINTNWSLRR
ncbi:MAG: right-handed parallel beta-helix repeat-containing protein [Kofleriaceae bacterium]